MLRLNAHAHLAVEYTNHTPVHGIRISLHSSRHNSRTPQFNSKTDTHNIASSNSDKPIYNTLQGPRQRSPQTFFIAKLREADTSVSVRKTLSSTVVVHLSSKRTLFGTYITARPQHTRRSSLPPTSICSSQAGRESVVASDHLTRYPRARRRRPRRRHEVSHRHRRAPASPRFLLRRILGEFLRRLSAAVAPT